MKKIFYQIMGLCSILGVATACNEDPEYFTLDEQPDEMHIVASTDKLVLDKGKEDETAITFTWDAASSPVNETDLVTYSLRLYATANKSANNTDFYELDTDRKKSFTHDELNAIIGTWVLPGQEVKVTAQVVCTVHNADKYIKPESSTVEFTVSGYEKYPTYIYIHMTDNEGKVSTQRLGQRNMGTGIYSLDIELPTLQADDWILDLGDVRESARVRINGQEAGCAWAVPYQLKVGQFLKPGKNHIEIEVTNLPANRIAELDRQGVQWRKFKEINIVDLNYRPANYGHWSPLPSGLNSEVRLIPVNVMP